MFTPIDISMHQTIQRPVALSSQVQREILKRVHSGELAPQAQLSPAVLGRRLGVSRTPVREALVKLVSDGVVDAVPGKGFVVREFSVREVVERFPVLWTLECLALSQTGPFPPERLARLRAVDAQLAGPGGGAGAWTSLDEEWHSTLLEGCPNQALLGLAASLRRCLRRYEYAYAFDAGRLPGAAGGHARVTAALGDGHHDAAVQALQEHWRSGMGDLAAWMGGRGE